MSAKTDTRAKPIFINALPLLSSAETLAGLIAEQGHTPTQVATAVNGDFVPARARELKLLCDGDRIEIVSARQGG